MSDCGSTGERIGRGLFGAWQHALPDGGSGLVGSQTFKAWFKVHNNNNNVVGPVRYRDFAKWRALEPQATTTVLDPCTWQWAAPCGARAVTDQRFGFETARAYGLSRRTKSVPSFVIRTADESLEWTRRCLLASRAGSAPPRCAPPRRFDAEIESVRSHKRRGPSLDNLPSNALHTVLTFGGLAAMTCCRRIRRMCDREGLWRRLFASQISDSAPGLSTAVTELLRTPHFVAPEVAAAVAALECPGRYTHCDVSWSEFVEAVRTHAPKLARGRILPRLFREMAVSGAESSDSEAEDAVTSRARSRRAPARDEGEGDCAPPELLVVVTPSSPRGRLVCSHPIKAGALIGELPMDRADRPGPGEGPQTPEAVGEKFYGPEFGIYLDIVGVPNVDREERRLALERGDARPMGEGQSSWTAAAAGNVLRFIRHADIAGEPNRPNVGMEVIWDGFVPAPPGGEPQPRPRFVLFALFDIDPLEELCWNDMHVISSPECRQAAREEPMETKVAVTAPLVDESFNLLAVIRALRSKGLAGKGTHVMYVL